MVGTLNNKELEPTMRKIVADISSLLQHIIELNKNIERYRPESCSYCGSMKLRRHGYYTRKADRENAGESNYNPVKIARFYCPGCRRTCSVLPECIPPRRWYLWRIQQSCIGLVLGGKSFIQVEKQTLPSRWTISRWINKLKEQFGLHTFHLKSCISELGHSNSFERFWKNCLEKMSLSKAMLILNNLGVIIP